MLYDRMQLLKNKTKHGFGIFWDRCTVREYLFYLLHFLLHSVVLVLDLCTGINKVMFSFSTSESWSVCSVVYSVPGTLHEEPRYSVHQFASNLNLLIGFCISLHFQSKPSLSLSCSCMFAVFSQRLFFRVSSLIKMKMIVSYSKSHKLES